MHCRYDATNEEKEQLNQSSSKEEEKVIKRFQDYLEGIKIKDLIQAEIAKEEAKKYETRPREKVDS